MSDDQRGPHESPVEMVERYIRDYLNECDDTDSEVDTLDLAEQIIDALDRRNAARTRLGLSLTDPPSGFRQS